MPSARSRGLRPSLDLGEHVVEPAQPRASQPQPDQVVLRAEVGVEGRLGDVGVSDDRVDPGRPDAVGPEQLRRGVDDSLPGVGEMRSEDEPDDGSIFSVGELDPFADHPADEEPEVVRRPRRARPTVGRPDLAEPFVRPDAPYGSCARRPLLGELRRSSSLTASRRSSTVSTSRPTACASQRTPAGGRSAVCESATVTRVRSCHWPCHPPARGLHATSCHRSAPARHALRAGRDTGGFGARPRGSPRAPSPCCTRTRSRPDAPRTLGSRPTRTVSSSGSRTSLFPYGDLADRAHGLDAVAELLVERVPPRRRGPCSGSPVPARRVEERHRIRLGAELSRQLSVSAARS